MKIELTLEEFERLEYTAKTNSTTVDDIISGHLSLILSSGYFQTLPVFDELPSIVSVSPDTDEEHTEISAGQLDNGDVSAESTYCNVSVSDNVTKRRHRRGKRGGKRNHKNGNSNIH